MYLEARIFKIKCYFWSNLSFKKFDVTYMTYLFLLAGPVSLSTPAQLVAPSVVVKGTLSVTSSELYFEVDEEDPNFKKIDPKVRRRGGKRLFILLLWDSVSYNLRLELVKIS